MRIAHGWHSRAAMQAPLKPHFSARKPDFASSFCRGAFV